MQNIERQAVILAGGRGTRLAPIIGNAPKALAKINGVTILEYQLKLCKKFGFTDIILLLGHQADSVISYIGDGSKFGVSCRYIVEKEPLGTAGSVANAIDILNEKFLVLYCDTMLDVNLDAFWNFFSRTQPDAAIFVHPNDHPFDSDIVKINEKNQIIKIARWDEDDKLERNLVSAALYIITKKLISELQLSNLPLDFGRDIFPAWIKENKNIIAYRSIEYIKDMGTPDRLMKVNQNLLECIVDPVNAERPRPAIFLDRDGVINVEKNGIIRASEFELLPNVAQAVKLINESYFAAIIISNQPYISFGKLTWTGLEEIHSKMDKLLAREQAYIDDIFICPHHPQIGFEGEIKELKMNCECRKPNPGLFFEAANKYNLDLNQSWMIGDRTVDIKAAKNASIKSILLQSGYGGSDGLYPDQPDERFDSLLSAIKFVTNKKAKF